MKMGEKRVFFVTGGIASGKSSFMKEAAKRGFECLSADKIAHQILLDFPREIAEFLQNDSFLVDGKISRQVLGELVFKDKALKTRLENFMHPKIREFIVEKIKKFKENSQNSAKNSINLNKNSQNSRAVQANCVNFSDFSRQKIENAAQKEQENLQKNSQNMPENSVNLSQNSQTSAQNLKNNQTRANALFIELPLFFETQNYTGLGMSILIYVSAKIALKRLMARNKLTREAALSRQRAQLDIEKKREMADFVIENFTTKAFKASCAKFFAAQGLA